MDDIHRSLRAVVAACVISAAWATPGHAADESPWSDDVRSAAGRLIGAIPAIPGFHRTSTFLVLKI
jgi:hypothetical protein